MRLRKRRIPRTISGSGTTIMPRFWNSCRGRKSGDGSTESSEILRFVGSMCRGPFIFRRMSAPRLEAIASTGSKLCYRHSLMRISFDHRDGTVDAGIRFHDERDGENLSLCGNYVEFTYRSCRFKIPVPENGARATRNTRGYALRLRVSSELHFTAFWQRRKLGDMIYICTFELEIDAVRGRGSARFEPGDQGFRRRSDDRAWRAGILPVQPCRHCFKQWVGPSLCGREALDQIVQ